MIVCLCCKLSLLILEECFQTFKGNLFNGVFLDIDQIIKADFFNEILRLFRYFFSNFFHGRNFFDQFRSCFSGLFDWCFCRSFYFRFDFCEQIIKGNVIQQRFYALFFFTLLFELCIFEDPFQSLCFFQWLDRKSVV